MRRALASIAATLALCAPAAHASLRLCNRTSYVLYAATAFADAGSIAVEGWTRIVPGECRIALKQDLTMPALYIYARSSPAHTGAPRAWAGNVNLCARDSDFSQRLSPLMVRCPSPDMAMLPFAQIATHHMRSWTTTFRETPDFPTMKGAQRAGILRLLGDIGAPVGAFGSDKAADSALVDFRKRMGLPGAASTGDLFGALETQAMKSTAPLGYTICNDTVKTVWAALGQQKGAVLVARGWWMVAAGSCAKAITDSVANVKTYLRVERSKGVALVSGPVKFCVTDITFEIQGREHCAARGLTEAGFAQTNRGGAPGFAAHVTEDGLAAGTPK